MGRSTLASIAQSQNNIKQIVLGLQGVASDNGGKLPGTLRSEKPFRSDTLVTLLPYVDQQKVYEFLHSDATPRRRRLYAQVSLYLNPLDPSYHAPNPSMDFGNGNTAKLAVSSYALNAQFFQINPRMSLMTDGASQTIWISEHYGWNCNNTTFLYTLGASSDWKPFQPPTFAQVKARPAPGDYYPVTTGRPPISTAADGKTFQVAPLLKDCDPRLPNASSSYGLQIGLGDGSVRTLSPTIAPQVFWGMVTPAGGEIISHSD
jgi:hypothetical protein